MYITYKEVRDYVTQAEPGTVVGVCGHPERCLIAEAVNEKYPEVRLTSVGLSSADSTVNIWTHPPHGIRERVTTGDDNAKLYRLGRLFDALARYNKPITREQALELFK